jgi:RNA polymerase sigma-70 factor (ECF subfamily)
VPDPAPGPEQQALTSETARRIEGALARLSPDQRLTVVLCDVQGLAYEEAAQVMSVELGTVKSRLSRARAQLRDLLQTAGELPTAARRLEQ